MYFEALKLVFKKIDPFITWTELLEKTLSEKGKTDLLNFIYSIKLSPNVRTILNAEKQPYSIKNLKTFLLKILILSVKFSV